MTIDPKTGRVNYNSKWDASKNEFVSGSYGGFNYDPYADYGTGIPGVMVVGRDPNGGATSYFAMDGASQSGRIYTDLSQAQAAAESYGAWKKTQEKYNPKPSAATAPPATSTPSSTGLGTQRVPGDAENQVTKNMAKYDQPSESEQLWNKYSGTYGNWDSSGLGGVIDREQQRAQRMMDQRASSRGYGDSAATTRAGAGLAQRFADTKVKNMQDWARTGMSLAGGADSGKLSRLGAGQSAANDAQSAKLLRESSGLNSAIQLGNNLAGTTQSGLNSIEENSLNMKMQELSAQMQKGNIDANTALAQAKDFMSINQIALNPTTLAYVQKLLSKPESTGLGATTGPSYTTQTINY
jgi:hypothetical protein